MKTLGNIIWIVFGGLHKALEYFIAGLILMITIIGIPFGKMHFRLAKASSFTFWERIGLAPQCLTEFKGLSV